MPTLLRMQTRFSRGGGGIPILDPMVNVWHLADLSSDPVDDARLTALEGPFDSFYGVWAGLVNPVVAVDEYRWYREPTGPGPSVQHYRNSARDIVGTFVHEPLPWQCAATLTLMVDERRHWGRVYLPGFTVQSDSGGWWDSSLVIALVEAGEDLGNGLRALNAELSVRSPTSGDYRAVTSVRCDNVVDIQRRRRADVTTLRETRLLTA